MIPSAEDFERKTLARDVKIEDQLNAAFGTDHALILAVSDVESNGWKDPIVSQKFASGLPIVFKQGNWGGDLLPAEEASWFHDGECAGWILRNKYWSGK